MSLPNLLGLWRERERGGGDFSVFNRITLLFEWRYHLTKFLVITEDLGILGGLTGQDRGHMV